MPKIVCYVHAYVQHGREAGAETTMANLLESMKSAGWDVQVILSTPGVPDYSVNGIPVRSEIDAFDLPDTAAKADMIISHLESSERAMLIAQKFKIPGVQLIHNTLWQTSGYLAVPGTRLAVFNSQWVKDHHDSTAADGHTSLVRRENDKLASITFKVAVARQWEGIVLHPQIDPANYPQGSEKRPFITMVNFHDNKGPEIFWAMAEAFPNQKFMAIQGGYGKQEIPWTLPGNVKVMRNTPLINNLYQRTKILLVPSHYESFGRVAIEAAAHGIPTVARETPGLREALGDAGVYANTPEEFKGALDVLTGRTGYYSSKSQQALDRSAYWDAQRPIETQAFIEKMESILPRR